LIKKIKKPNNQGWNKNKFKLEIINVNKTVSIMRRGTESKEKRNWKVDIFFCMQFMKRKQGKETKNNKLTPNQT